MKKIIVDAFGGDSPLDVIEGAVLSSKERKDIEISLVGNRNKILKLAEKSKLNLESVSIIDCESEIENTDNPMSIVESKKNSSMAIGLQYLAQKKADIFVSTGNSGALLVGTSLIVKKSPGIRRIAFAPFIPKLNGKFLFLDAGANSQCSAEILYQFAVMGSEHLKKFSEIKSPKVALLNIGFENHKGDNLRKEAFQILSSSNEINFIENMEPNNVFFSDCDVLVSDGFNGNIFLKTIEGMVKVFMSLIKKDTNGLKFLESQEHIYLNPKKFAEASYSNLLGANARVIKLHSSISKFGISNFLNSI